MTNEKIFKKLTNCKFLENSRLKVTTTRFSERTDVIFHSRSFFFAKLQSLLRTLQLLMIKGKFREKTISLELESIVSSLNYGNENSKAFWCPFFAKQLQNWSRFLPKMSKRVLNWQKLGYGFFLDFVLQIFLEA